MHALKRFAAYTTARLLLIWFKILGPEGASSVGGAIARSLGPLLPVSRVADQNLRVVLPELDETARRVVIRDVWDNFGRTLAEMPHLAALEITDTGPGFEIQGAHNLPSGPAIYVSGHFGNWEALPPIISRLGKCFSSVYRAANDKRVDGLVIGLRRAAVRADIPMFPKGPTGARAIIGHLARGEALGMLVDQKMNDGIEATLLGKPAMTAPAAAAFALRYKYPIIPGRIERVGPARLKLIVEPPIPFPNTGDHTADVRALTQAINDTLSRWIRALPGHWFWLHRRWPKEVIAAGSTQAG